MATSISSYSLSITAKVTTNTFVSTKKVFADGEVMLNGKRVNIGGSLESAARKINQISKFTGIKAEIKVNGNKQRLVLVTFGNNININDPKKLLLDLYKTGKINSADGSFIQIKNRNNRTVEINYTTGAVSSTAKNLLKDAFNGADNVRYIKGTAALVNPVNILNEINVQDEVNTLEEDEREDFAPVPEILDNNSVHRSYERLDDDNLFDGDEGFNFSISASDVLWGIASIAYDATREIVRYGYNTANSYLFDENR